MPAATPVQQSLDANLLDQAVAYLDYNFPPWVRLSIARHGQVVWDKRHAQPRVTQRSHLLQRVFKTLGGRSNLARATTLDQFAEGWNTRSVTKSITALLVGVALDRGQLHSLDEKVCDHLPAYFTTQTDPRKKSITLRHLLTMTSGLDSVDTGLAPLKLLRQTDWVRYLFDRPLTHSPGEAFIYNSANPHLLSAIITQATGQSLEDFAVQHLFEPLGIQPAWWPSDPHGYTFGSGDLFLTSEDLIKIGQLCLQRGLWNGKQIVSAAWLDESWRPYQSIGYGFDYGYLWYSRQEQNEAHGRTYRVYSAAGIGGQRLFIVPDLDMVMVALARTDFAADKSYHVNLIVSQYVLPAALN